MIRYKPSKFLRYSAYILLALALACVAFVFQKKVVNDNILATITYVENQSSDYKVFYKANKFYQNQYIKSGESYVTSYINYIDLDFNYISNFTEAINGEYSYKIDGSLVVFNPDDKDEKYLKKDYKLDKGDLKKVKDVRSNVINYNLRFDFPTYLEEYQAYKKADPSVISDAKFVITMSITNKAVFPGVEDIKFDSTITYEIPLSESTFKITSSNTLKDQPTTKNSYESNESKRVYVKSISLVAWIATFIVLLKFAYTCYIDNKNKNVYEKKLNRILNTYDSILVSVSAMQNIEGLSIINVDSFDELVDAQAEVRLPINYKVNKENRSTTFILVRNNMAWVYSLRESELDE